jgi:UDP-N-acetylglucosamine 2-epimerase (non-hydrolysing)
MHPNPAVRRSVVPLLGGVPRAHLVEPMDYLEMTAALARCALVLTDSGGLQEEAPALGKPVLVLRDKTERPEAIAAGVAALVGTRRGPILAAATRLLSDPSAHAAMAAGGSPFGDGQAGPRIAAICGRFLRGCLETASLQAGAGLDGRVAGKPQAAPRHASLQNQVEVQI